MSETTEPQPAPPPPPPPAAPFRLVRARTERRLSGVAGGFAAAAGLDPTLVRLGMVLAALTGWGVLAYIVAWAVIPEEDPAAGRPLTAAPESTAQALRIGLAVAAGLGALQLLGGIFGLVFALLGGLFTPFGFYGFDDDVFFPGRALAGVALLAGGAYVLYRRRHPGGAGPATDDRRAFAAAGDAPAPASGASPVAAPSTSPARWSPPPVGAAPVPPPPSAGAPGAPAPGRSRSEILLLLARAAGWLLLLWFVAGALGVAGLVATGGLDVRWPLVPAVAAIAAVGALGTALIRYPRLGVLAGAAAALAVPVLLVLLLGSFDGPAGSRTVVAASADELERTYRHSFGELRLDLSELQVPAGATRQIGVRMGAGNVTVVVPPDTAVRASTRLGIGRYSMLDRHEVGVRIQGEASSAGDAGAGTLVFDVRIGVGEVTVERVALPPTQAALEAGEDVYLSCRQTGRGIRCDPPDGYPTPELSCLVSEANDALCRPVGEGDADAHWADDPETRRCTVPAGGGRADCTAVGEEPPPAQPATPAPPAPAPAPPPPAPAPGTPTEPGTYVCTIPPGGGEATCRPA